MLTVDPTNLCTVNCKWCKNRDFRSQFGVSIPDGEFVSIPQSVAEWGVKAILLSGGEPLLHPKITEFINGCGQAKLQIGLKTNAVGLSKPTLRKAVLSFCDWIGISVDAATANTYLKAKRAPANAFEKVIANVKWLVENRGETKKPRITMKFLIHHLNYGEMFAFADLGKNLGVDEIHYRPAYIPKYRFTRGVRKTAEYYLREARKNFEDVNFHVYGIVMKFEREWEKVVRFKKCCVTPISGVLAANGIFYLCADRRGDETLHLGPYTNFKELVSRWGSISHREKVNKILPQLCPKCGMCLYNEVIEHCIAGHEMALEFL
jgi:MoaA/NifB/PqqE/SkfB family radical SAM enzyme